MVLGWRRRKSSKRKTNNLIAPITTTAQTLEIPTHFLCPISLDLMRDPVTLSSGLTYDRDGIEAWLDSGAFTCPVTNQVLQSFDRVPNHALRKMIQEWCTARGADRVPTPRVPVTPDEISRALLALETSAECLDWRAAAEQLARVQDWAAEGERTKRSIKISGSVNSLTKAFDFFATAYYDKSININNSNNYLEICNTILPILSWMIPFDNGIHPRVRSKHTCIYVLGSGPSLYCMVRFLTDPAVKKYAATVLEELTNADEAAARSLAKTEGVAEALIGGVRAARSCPKAAKASLAVIRSLLLLGEGGSELIRTGFVTLVLELLVESEKGAIAERALGVLDALCGHKEGIKEVIENGLTIPVLVKKLLRVSTLATEFSVSAIWKLLCDREGNDGGDQVSNAIVEALQVGAFQKLLVIIQVGCGDETKEKVTELLKLLNTYRPEFECIESLDFKSLKRSF